MILFDFMVQRFHPSSDQLEAYSLGLLSDADLDETEEHLLICECCQDELALADRHIRAAKSGAATSRTIMRLRSIHITADGPIFGAVHIGTDGKWLARHWDRQLDGGRICSSVDEADAYLMDSFWQMFPEHECSQQCLAQLKPV